MNNFPPLSNVYQRILSNVSRSITRLYQCKPVINDTHVSVHVNPAYTSSASELIKPLTVSTPACSSNTTKRNVCNTSSASQLIKPLNLSKPALSSNATKRNVCNASSVSQLVKPLHISKLIYSNNATVRNVCKVSSVSQLVKPSIVSKPVCSNNMTKCNVRNGSSASQLVKTFNASKPVCSNNACNPVICNCTCKPVSNFVGDCQSAKPVPKLIDVNQKRPREQFVKKMSTRQHGFTKPFSAVNIFIKKAKLCKAMYLKLSYLAIFLIVIFRLKFQIKDGLLSILLL